MGRATGLPETKKVEKKREGGVASWPAEKDGHSGNLQGSRDAQGERRLLLTNGVAGTFEFGHLHSRYVDTAMPLSHCFHQDASRALALCARATTGEKASSGRCHKNAVRCLDANCSDAHASCDLRGMKIKTTHS